MRHQLYFITITTCLLLNGCWVVAAGAGAEGAYVLTQEGRTAGETLSDQAITTSVKTKLLADSEVSGLNINVDTFRGKVVLKGVVSGSYEAEKAVQIALHTDGVKEVTSKLAVID